MGGLFQPSRDINEEYLRALAEMRHRQMTHQFSGSGMPNQGQRLQNLLGGVKGLLADLSPGYGDVLASQRASQAYGQAWDALKQGQLGQAFGKGAEALAENISIVPGIGDAAALTKGAAGMFAGGGVIKEMRAPAWNKAIRSFPLAEKATMRDLKGLLMESDTLRVLDTPSGLYAWPANAALHEDVARMLGLPLDAKQFGLLTRESLH